MAARDSLLIDRRLLMAGLSAVAGCKPAAPARAVGPARLDTVRLTTAFPSLARRARPGGLGLGVGLAPSGPAWVSDAKARFPLQSVFKVFLAGAALAQVDAGSLKLAEPIVLTDADRTPLYSAIGPAWKGGDLTLPLVDLIALAIQRSDNIAADALMKRIGGPAKVTAWLQSKDVEGVRIDRYEREIQPQSVGLGTLQPGMTDKAWQAAREAVPPAQREAAITAYLADPRDTATLAGSLDYLTRLANGQLLSPASTRLLLRLMTDAATGSHRLKAGLPPGAILAHKTGTSATVLGLTPATNDIGIVTLPSGRRFVIAAYLAGSTATETAREDLIADAARLATACVS
ncbi:MAG TPA: class A beta-lactamase [Caulobacteraceae bacterium]|nr:class A beta-lactamase [Caulobacteraceae bacterium]